MLAGLERSLAQQVERGKLEPTTAPTERRSTRVQRRHRPRRARVVRPRARVDRRGPPHEEALFAELDRICAPAPILATNTSTLPVIEMAMVTGRPDRVCGVHFFNPAPVMSLVEIVPAITTSDETIAEARDVRRGVRQDRRRRQGPGRVRRERAAVPLPQQRGEALRRRRRVPRRHRRGDEGRLQLPDGPARAARPRRPRHQPRDPRRALRRVPRPELRAGAAAAPHGERRAGSAARTASASTTTGSSRYCRRYDPLVGENGRGRPALGDADVLGSFVGARVERALPDQPGQGPDRPLGRVRPPHPDRLRPRPPARPRRGRQGRRAGTAPRRDARAVRRASRSTR